MVSERLMLMSMTVISRPMSRFLFARILDGCTWFSCSNCTYSSFFSYDYRNAYRRLDTGYPISFYGTNESNLRRETESSDLDRLTCTIYHGSSGSDLRLSCRLAGFADLHSRWLKVYFTSKAHCLLSFFLLSSPTQQH